jgi:hypothetical protein
MRHFCAGAEMASWGRARRSTPIGRGSRPC